MSPVARTTSAGGSPQSDTSPAGDFRALETPIAAALLEADTASAARLARQQAQLAETQLGESAPSVQLTLRAAFLTGLNADHDTEAELLERALSMARRLPPADKPILARALMDNAGSFRGRGELEASAFHWERAIEVWSGLGVENRELVQCHTQLVQIYDDLGEPERADPHSRRSYEIADRDPNMASIIASNHVHRRLRRGDLEGARRVSDALWAEAEQRGEVTTALRNLRMHVHIEAGEFDEAVAVARSQLAKGQAEDEGYNLRTLGIALRAAGQWPEAVEVGERFLALQVETFGADALATSVARQELAKALLGRGEPAGAREQLDKTVAIVEAQLAVEDSEYQRASLRAARELLDSIPE